MPSPKELALRALQANQEHQYALAQHAEKLAAELAELDKLISQADTEDGDSDLECDFYIPNANPPVGPIRNFTNPESPFYEDAMKRTRYLNFTARHTMAAKEVEALKAAVDAELRRVEQLEGASSTTTDTQMADKLDWIVIAEKVSDSSTTKRTPEECKIKWMDVNGNQTPVNWVQVAKELGNNRLPLDCMRYSQERRGHVWTPELDQKVIDAVRQYGQCWSLVAKYVSPHLAPGQCSARYLRTLDPTLHRGAWSSEEDERLKAAVAGYGKAWSEVATVVPGRTNEQCRDRWLSILDPVNKKKEDWDEEDEEVLIKAVKTQGRKWKAIAVQMNRTPADVRIRYDSLQNVGGARAELSDEDEALAEPAPKPRARKPRAKKAQSQEASDAQDGVEEIDLDQPVKPRPKPKPLAKTKGKGRGRKRAAPDSDEEYSAKPRKRRAVKEVVSETESDSDSPPVEEETSTEQNPEPTTDTASPAKKGKGRDPQPASPVPPVDELPRRRSVRIQERYVEYRLGYNGGQLVWTTAVGARELIDLRDDVCESFHLLRGCTPVSEFTIWPSSSPSFLPFGVLLSRP
ncbi:hypothetical protein B0H16DRAFT_1710692 [Mycena metata]|uniref:Uncharacterized protein n=1 Tax=Mycena metata TaxID=1033252 RepID=A0AAD7KC10_9AGAR|nr:hypothetical protein B0H16DRAFT_1710692 [Mycena metata]